MKITMVFAMMFATTALCAQETGYRDFGGRVDSESMPVPEELPSVDAWLPFEEFAGEMEHEYKVSMTTPPTVVEPQPPRVVLVLPNNTLRVWRINISNGSAGNWGSTPNSYLDARTLSFPTP